MAATSPATATPLPTGRRNVLKHLIHQAGGAYIACDSSFSSSHDLDGVLKVDVVEAEESEVALGSASGDDADDSSNDLSQFGDLSNFASDHDLADTNFLPTDDQIDYASLQHSSNPSDIYTEDFTSDNDYDSEDPYTDSSDDSDHFPAVDLGPSQFYPESVCPGGHPKSYDGGSNRSAAESGNSDSAESGDEDILVDTDGNEAFSDQSDQSDQDHFDGSNKSQRSSPDFSYPTFNSNYSDNESEPSDNSKLDNGRPGNSDYGPCELDIEPDHSANGHATDLAGAYSEECGLSLPEEDHLSNISYLYSNRGTSENFCSDSPPSGDQHCTKMNSYLDYGGESDHANDYEGSGDEDNQFSPFPSFIFYFLFFFIFYSFYF